MYLILFHTRVSDKRTDSVKSGFGLMTTKRLPLTLFTFFQGIDCEKALS